MNDNLTCRGCLFLDQRYCKRLKRHTLPVDARCGWYIENTFDDDDQPVHPDTPVVKQRIEYDYHDAVACIREHAPACVSYKYIREHTGYSGSFYLMKKNLASYPDLECFKFGGSIGMAWRSNL